MTDTKREAPERIWLDKRDTPQLNGTRVPPFDQIAHLYEEYVRADLYETERERGMELARESKLRECDWADQVRDLQAKVEAFRTKCKEWADRMEGIQAKVERLEQDIAFFNDIVARQEDRIARARAEALEEAAQLIQTDRCCCTRNENHCQACECAAAIRAAKGESNSKTRGQRQ